MALLFVALPAQALICCKCYPTGNIDQAACLTDPAIQCGDFTSKINNPNIKGYTCDTVNEAKCKPITPDNGLCPAAPVDATAYVPPTGSVIKTHTPFEPIIPEISQQTHIPGLQFSQQLDIQGDKVVIPFLAEYIQAVYKYLIGISVIAAAVMIVWGGFKYLLSGTITDVKVAKGIITDAVIGLVLVFSATTILYTIGGSALTNLNAVALTNIQPFYLEQEEVNPDVPPDAPGRNGAVGNKPFLAQTPFDDDGFTPIPGEAQVPQPLPVPEYKQYGGTWGNVAYGDKPACSGTNDKPTDANGNPCCTTYFHGGCGPTSLAELYKFNGADATPLDVGQMLSNRGLRRCNSGTSIVPVTISTDNPFGLKLVAVSSIENVVKTLRSGQPVMFACNHCIGKMKTDSVAPNPPAGLGEKGHVSRQDGWKTYGGHFMVLTGVDDQGKIFTVSDVGNEDNYGIVNISQGQLRNSTNGFWAVQK